MPPATATAPRLATQAELLAASPWLTAGCLDWMLRQRRRNGLAAAGAIVRIGRLIMIDLDRWAAWLDSRRERGE